MARRLWWLGVAILAAGLAGLADRLARGALWLLEHHERAGAWGSG